MTRDQSWIHVSSFTTTVIRGGFGLSYFTHAFGFYGTTLGGMYPVTINALWGVQNDYLVEGSLSRVPTPEAPVVPTNGILNPAPDQIFWFIPNNSEFPYVASRNLTVEQALPGKITLEIAYVGNRAFHQPVQYDTNQAPPGAGAAGRVLLLRYGRTSPTNTRANIRDANYNSLQVLLKRRFSAGIHFQLAYTFAKALDNLQVSSVFAPDRYDYGPVTGSNYQTLVISHVWEIPFGRGRKYLGHGVMSHIVGDWALNGVLVAKTGNVFSVSADAAALNASGAANRPDVVGPIRYLGGVGPGTRWFDTSAFARPQALKFGNAGRNILVGPGLANYDFGLFRTFPIRERYRLQVRGEFFNLTNTPHFNNPGAAQETTTFGTVSTAFGDRRVQLGAKLQF